jgi:hypothetical protein
MKPRMDSPSRDCHARRGTPRRSRESGYALLLVLFMMAAMVIASTAVITDHRTEGRRVREEQMIWRGNQFVRAIRLYYRRAGHYPQNLDELEKGLVNIHFLRPEALRDPMNTGEDAQWRFIYTNPSGQIIGSVRYATMQQMAVLDLYAPQIASLQKANSQSGEDNGPGVPDSGPGPGVPETTTSTANCPPGASTGSGLAQPGAGTIGSPAAGPGSGPGALGGSAQMQSPFSLQLGPGGPSPAGQTSTASTTCGPQLAGIPPMAPAALQSLLDMKPTGPVDSPVIGGFLVGVGSTVDRKSVKIYRTGKKYNQWEFIYNPIEEQARAIQQGLGQGGAPGGLLGAPGNGLPGPATTTTGGIGSSPIQAVPTQPQPDQQ